MTRKLSFGAVPTHSVEAKLDWCINALRQIEIASSDINVFNIADSFTVTNLTKDRTFDADSTSTAEIADILGTLIQDIKDRGQKST